MATNNTTLGVIKSIKSNNYIKVLDYDFIDGEIVLTFIYKNKRMTMLVDDRIRPEVPGIGQRYVIVDKDVFLINNASTYKGAL